MAAEPVGTRRGNLWDREGRRGPVSPSEAPPPSDGLGQVARDRAVPPPGPELPVVLRHREVDPHAVVRAIAVHPHGDVRRARRFWEPHVEPGLAVTPRTPGVVGGDRHDPVVELPERGRVADALRSRRTNPRSHASRAPADACSTDHFTQPFSSSSLGRSLGRRSRAHVGGRHDRRPRASARVRRARGAPTSPSNGRSTAWPARAAARRSASRHPARSRRTRWPASNVQDMASSSSSMS